MSSSSTRPLLLLGLLAVGVSCGPKAAEVDAAPAAGVPQPPDSPSAIPQPADISSLPAYARDLWTDVDVTVDPCVDFYQFACGGWEARTELPADRPRWGRSFSEINERNEKWVRQLLDEAAANPDGGDDDWRRLGTMYAACMDEEAIEAAGITGLQPHLDQIDGITDLKGLSAVTGGLHKISVDVFWGAQVEGDFVDPGLQIMHMGQSGLSLPDRDYYLEDDEKMKGLRTDLVPHIAATLQQAGLATADDATARAEAVVAFETALAEVHQPRAALRDPTKIYNRVDRDLGKVSPEVDWDGWLTALDGGHVQHISVDSKEVFAQVTGIIAKTDLAVLKDYMRWAVIRDHASHLPKAYDEAHFAFFGTKVTGQEEQSPRWKRCGRAVSGAMGEAIGRKYIDKYFAGESRTTALALIGGIQDAFEAGLPQLDWMDETTRERAIEKKNTLVNKIGYPDKWTDYGEMDLTADNHLSNVMAAKRFEHGKVIARASKPTDRSLWHMTPHMVNAYYHPLLNEMAFPAGILQPPFFEATRPSAMNFGGIGMVMGHELTHGFDDSGSQFDPEGKVRDWWEPESRERFEERTGCVSDFYSAYEPLPGTHINGALTNGENIADIGGARVAYRAFKASDGAADTVDGLTPDQLFFVSFAQGWCSLAKDEYLQMQIASDPHSPAKYRVIGTVSQLPEFHEAFACAEGTPMHPATQCTIW